MVAALDGVSTTTVGGAVVAGVVSSLLGVAGTAVAGTGAGTSAGPGASARVDSGTSAGAAAGASTPGASIRSVVALTTVPAQSISQCSSSLRIVTCSKCS